MDAKKWVALLAAVRHGSFSKAAEELGYTQSGLSYLMNSLEEECGVPLLMRSWSGVRLTEEGEALLPEIRALVAADAALSHHLGELGALQKQHIRIGTYASLSVHWLSHIIPAFQSAMPETELEIRTGSRAELVSLLERSEIDLAFCDHLDIPSVEWTELYADPLLAVLPSNHPAAANERFSPADAGDFPFLIPPDSNTGNNDLRHRFARAANVRVRTEDDTVNLSLVRQGVGFCIMSDLVLRGRMEGLAVVPLEHPLYRRLGINRKTGLGTNRALRQMLLLLRSNPPDPDQYTHTKENV